VVHIGTQFRYWFIMLYVGHFDVPAYFFNGHGAHANTHRPYIVCSKQIPNVLGITTLCEKHKVDIRI